MGIVKVRLRKLSNDNFAQQSSVNRVNEFEQEGRVLLEEDLIDDSDDCELADAGCEFVMVGDQMCNIPYDLYDLTDLKEVLSIETWNSCLNEEERFSLSAYLPDMDQHTFWLTMRGLLCGEDIFFGSPLENLFQSLKGGFYSPKVVNFRKGLHTLQRRAYYHSLRSYHENMAEIFRNMKKVWSNCAPSIDVEERVRIWRRRRDHKPVYMVDLNAFPADEERLTRADKKVVTVPVLKKTKCMNSERETPHVTPSVAKNMSITPQLKPKGVLKIMPVKMSSAPNGIVQALPSEILEPLRPPPKGVLKIKPKSESLHQQEKFIAMRPALTSVEESCPRTSRSSLLRHSTFERGLENFHEASCFLHHEVGDRKAYRSPELPSFVGKLQREDFSKRNTGRLSNLQSLKKKLILEKGVKYHKIASLPGQILPMRNSQNMGMYSHETSGSGEKDGENLWQNSRPGSSELCSNFAESYQFVPHHCEERRQMIPLISGKVSRISTTTIDGCEMFPNYEKSELRHGDLSGKGSMKLSDHSSVSEGLTLPITYKRKKAYTKHVPINSLKKPIAGVGLHSRSPYRTDCHQVEKAKSVKIKFKIWNGYDNPQFKQGLLNGLQHGS